MRLACLAAVAVCSVVAAAPEEGLLLHYTFDEGKGDVVKDLSGNGNDGTIHDAVFVPSPRGSALQFDDAKKGFLDCGRNPMLNIRGDLTVEFWIRVAPDVKRDRYNDKFIFGDTATLAVNRNFYISWSDRRLRMEHGNGKAVEQLLSAGPVFDGTWQHIAFVCEFPYYHMYVNGGEVSSGEMSMPITPTEITPRHVGGWWWDYGYFKGEIDELRVYNRALPEETIMEHAGLGTATATAVVQDLQPILHYCLQRLDVTLLCKHTTAGHATDLTVARKGGDVLLQQTLPIAETRAGTGRGVVQTSFDTVALTAGEYVVRATLRDNSGKTPDLLTEKPFTWPEKPEWFGSKAGTGDHVLPPYTELRVESGEGRVAISPWGRRYEFGPAPFLSGVQSLGQPLLSGPVRVALTVDGQSAEFQGSAPTVETQSAAKAVLAQRATAGRLALTTRTLIEYDGFVRTDWQFAAETACTIDRLVVELPLVAESAKYTYTWGGTGVSGGNGYLPAGGRDLPFRPLVWLGDEERGLEWFAESDRNWSLAAEDRAIQIVKDKNEVVLRLNLVAQGVKLEPNQPLTYTFGVQATPLKPMTRTNWDYRFHHISQTTHGPVDTRLRVPDPVLDELAAKGVKTICFHEHWTDCQGYSKTSYEADLDGFVRGCHQRGMKVLLYFGFNISDLIPEWPYIGADCVVHPKSGYLPFHYPPQPVQNAYVVCLNSVYQDLLVDGIARLVDRFGIDGAYLDTTVAPSPCTNQWHGCGYRRPDGSLAPTYPVFAVRGTLRRMYAVIRERKPDGLVDAHVYDAMNAPALAFATSYWTGEQLARVDFAPDGLPLDRFRTEFMGVNWGVPAETLHYMLGSYQNALALALLHGVVVRSAGLNADFNTEAAVWKAMDEFGRHEARWYPYWTNAAYLTLKPNGCYASLYAHPRNGVMVVVANLTRQEARILLTLDLAKLALTDPLATTDALTGAAVESRGGTLTTSLPSVGWQMIRVKPGQ